VLVWCVVLRPFSSYVVVGCFSLREDFVASGTAAFAPELPTYS
jgi:hypothetical protein